jgi:hypothetical protein
MESQTLKTEIKQNSLYNNGFYKAWLNPSSNYIQLELPKILMIQYAHYWIS